MEPFVDLHCHPSYKPFGLACSGIINSDDPSLANSIWYDDPPTNKDKRQSKNLTVTRFSQSNFTSLFKGNFKIVIGALSPTEKEFFPPKYRRSDPLQEKKLPDFLYDFVTGIGRKKVDFIQENTDDFKELNCEYEFYKQLHNKEFTIYGEKVCYRLTSDYNEIERNLNIQKNVISVVLSIEGGNLFNSDNTNVPQTGSILRNIDTVKNWEQPPFFVTLCHHFFNYLGGQAESLPEPVSKILDDSPGRNTGLTPLGEKVIDHLLSKTNGRRIYIDIKHMSRQTRSDYYKILESNRYKNEKIPIIVSHGACNGYSKLELDVSPNEKNGTFNGRDINFYDDEIVRIAKSGGIFGLQIDKRQLTNTKESKKINRKRSTGKKSKIWTGLIWKQIRHIAELLDRNNLPAWDIISIGTDFDGITTPPDGYWTSRELIQLFGNLFNYTTEYMRPRPFSFSANNISPEKIMNKIFSGNARDFLKKFYHT